MKKIKLFYLQACPYCKKAFAIIEKLKKDSKYKDIEIQTIEESENPELSDSYDYYYVPSFFLDEKKELEGVVMSRDIKALFDKALEK